MKKRMCMILAMILLSGMVGCGKPETSNPGAENYKLESGESTAAAAENLPDSYLIDQEDNYIDFQTGLECSAFSSAYVLRHFGESADGMKLYENFPEKMADGGVMPQGILTLFESRGYVAEYCQDGTIDDLKAEVSKGVPVIVFIHVSEPYTNPHYTHYVPMVGYDDDYIYLAESLSYLANCKDETEVPYNRKVEISKFEKLWSNIDGMWDHPYYVIAQDRKRSYGWGLSD